MKKILFLFLSMLCLLSCTQDRQLRRASRKFNRILADNPEMIRTDSVLTTDLDTMPAIRARITVPTVTDAPELENILNPLYSRMDSLQAAGIVEQVRQYIAWRPILSDTVTRYTQDSIRIQVFPTGKRGEIGVSVHRDARVTSETQVVATTTITPGNIPRKTGMGFFPSMLLTLFLCGLVIWAWFTSRKIRP